MPGPKLLVDANRPDFLFILAERRPGPYLRYDWFRVVLDRRPGIARLAKDPPAIGRTPLDVWTGAGRAPDGRRTGAGRAPDGRRACACTAQPASASHRPITERQNIGWLVHYLAGGLAMISRHTGDALAGPGRLFADGFLCTSSWENRAMIGEL